MLQWENVHAITFSIWRIKPWETIVTFVIFLGFYFYVIDRLTAQRDFNVELRFEVSTIFSRTVMATVMTLEFRKSSAIRTIWNLAT